MRSLARLRRRESRALLESNLPAGAYYLAGYAVECALKAKIASSTRQYEFPNKTLANDCYTHDLSKLMRLSGLQTAFDSAAAASPGLARNWAIVKDWKETSRYDGTIDLRKARTMYGAVSARRIGVLAWLRQHW